MTNSPTYAPQRTSTPAEASTAATDVHAEAVAGARQDTVADEHPQAVYGPDSGSSEDAVPRRATRAVTFVVIPLLVLAATIGAGWLKYLQVRHQANDTARIESMNTAKDTTVAMLSYDPDSAAATLGTARDRLTGSLRDSYTSLINDVVIPGAQQKRISAAANVAAAASISASQQHAVVLVFVNQSITQGQDPPSGTASTVRVTLDKVGSRWLVSGFDPI